MKFKKNNILNFTTLYRSGNPIDTNATIIKTTDNDFTIVNKINKFSIKPDKNSVILTRKLDSNDKVFGLGESLGSLNKRGKRYSIYCTDDALHTPEKESLYGAHPFIIIVGKDTFGLFIDYPSRIIFDIGFTDIDTLQITITSTNFDLYIYDSNSVKDIIKENLLLTGRPYFPPKWAFGYFQSRWSYPDAKSVEKIADNFRKFNIPCNGIFLDLDYMDNFKVFTTSEKRFPNFKKFIAKMKKKGFRLIPIIDPGVKVEEGYEIYEEAKNNNYFCKDKDGKDFIATVWPGKSCFPDFLNNEVREWWANCNKKLIDCGIEGFWNDMNEPSIFNTPASLDRLFKDIDKLRKNKNLGIEFLGLKDMVTKIQNSIEDYKAFYHNLDSGQKVSNDEVHNLFGSFMAKATALGFNKFLQDKRYFLISRASYTGLHRVASVWMGDNSSWWEHLIVHIRMLISLNLTGFFYTGPDIGGFGCNTSPELLTRWIQLGIFTPLFRNHSALFTRDQEPWAFDKNTLNIIKNMIEFRYAILPYIYSEFKHSLDNLLPFIAPLFLHFKDTVEEIEDQFMFGSSIMVCPVYVQNAKKRFVYLPQGKWLKWNVSKYNKINIAVMESGAYYIDVDISETLIFIKENSLITMGEPVDYIGQKKLDNLTVIAFVTDSLHYSYYEDDGETTHFDKNFATLDIDIIKENDNFEISVNKKENGNYKCIIKTIDFIIYDELGKQHNKKLHF